MEFDVYNAELKLALEHNGPHHYAPQEPWGGQKAFEKMLEHDHRKREYCAREGITFIEIRELGEVTPPADLRRIIKEACIAGGVPLPSDYDDIKLDFFGGDIPSTREGMWGRILKRAADAGYTLITKEYTRLDQRIELVCPNGHHWKPSAHTLIYSKNLCQVCKFEREQRPVVVFPLSESAAERFTRSGLLFETMNAAAKWVGGQPSQVRSVAGGKLPSIKGCGVAAITREQAAIFKRDASELSAFCSERIAFSRWRAGAPRISRLSD
ncbi:MAG: hypothetical protein K8R87_10065 [Verrucomicrobia bacterium]|nr:hypothetical protein [Verrucomicrobiota bacterium]